MSVTESDLEGIDFEASGGQTFHEDAEKVLEELDDRFQEHSSVYENDRGSQALIIVPGTPYIKDDGDVMNHIFMSGETETLREHGFHLDFVTRASEGVGVKFWFRHED